MKTWFDNMIQLVHETLYGDQKVSITTTEISDYLSQEKQVRVIAIKTEDTPNGEENLNTPIIIEPFGTVTGHNMVRIRSAGSLDNAWVMNAVPRLVAAAIMEY